MSKLFEWWWGSSEHKDSFFDGRQTYSLKIQLQACREILLETSVFRKFLKRNHLLLLFYVFLLFVITTFPVCACVYAHIHEYPGACV